RLIDYATRNFYDRRTGMFFYSPINAENLVLRKIEIWDNAMPSSNAVMAEALYTLSIYFENEDYLNKSSRMLSGMAAQMNSNAAHYSQWCFLAGMFSHGTYEVAVMGKDAIAKNMELQKRFLPKCLFMGATGEENLPLLENKMPANK